MFDFLISMATIGGLYAIMALGLNIQAGYGGLLNFGHIAFAGIGAYATGIAHTRGWSPLVGISMGIAVATMLGWCIGRLGRRLAADYWGIATLAIAEIVRTVAINEEWLTGGANGITAIPGLFDGLPRPVNDLAFMALVLCVVGALAFVSVRLGDGRFGRAIRLMREQPQLAACMGYHLQSLKTRTIMTGAAVTSLAGSLYAHYLSFAGPELLLAAETFVLWTMVMIGGLGRTTGVLLGVLIMQLVYAFVPFAKDVMGFDSDLAGALRLGMIGLILLACLLWRRDGLLPEQVRNVA